MPGLAYPERIVNVNVKITDITATKSAGHIYQNTSNRPLLITFSAVYYGKAGTACYDAFFVKATSPPNTNVAFAGTSVQALDFEQQHYQTTIIVIPPGWFWEWVTTLGGASSVVYQSIQEIQL